MKLRLKNFQSAEDCELDIPEKAFTCVVGPTNIGKSAIRRAFECVWYNKSEVSYIRNGATHCEVELTLGDGTHIKWSRDKKTAFYEINGEKFSKLNGSVPDIILQKGFRELILNKDKEKMTVQISPQFPNLFLLNQPGGKITEVLSNLGNLNKIIEANKSCLSDKKNIKSRLKIRLEDNDICKEKLSSFGGLDNQKSKVENLKNIVSNLKNLQSNKEKATKILVKLQKSMVTVSELRKLKNVEPPIFDISLDQVKSLTLFNSKHYMLSNKLTKYKDLALIKEISFNLEEDLSKFAKVKKLYDNLNKQENKVANYKSSPNLISDFDLNPGQVASLRKLADKLEIVKGNVLAYRSNILESENKFIQLESQHKELRHELKVCPLCDSNLI